MELLGFLLSRSRRALILAALFGFVSGALNSGLLAVVNIAISHTPSTFSQVFVAFVVLCVLAGATRVLSETVLVRLIQDSVFSLRISLGRQVLMVPLRKLEQLGPHRVLSVLTDDIPNIANAAGVIPLLCINLGLVISCLAYMGWLQPRLLLAVLGFAAVGIVTYQLGVSHALHHFQRARECENDVQKHFQGLIYGIKELKLHRRRREHFLSLKQQTAGTVREENIAGLIIYSIASSWGQLLVFTLIGLVIFFLAGFLRVTGGVLTGFTFALLYLMTPLQMIMNSIPGLARAGVAISSVQQMGLNLSSSDELGESAPGDNAEFSERAKRLELRDVVYTYRSEDSGDEFTLGPVSLTVGQGELLFITGGNGSGKTTLAKLILGLYTPDAGEIRYGGELVTNANRDAHRQCFSAVFSDFFLFDSLLGLDLPQLDQQARAYLSALRLEKKVQVQNGVLSSTQLSQGQRKRLALLTSCLEDRPVFFFDEWAADQDPVFKEVFYRSILPGLKARGKTVIAISHDDRYYDAADRIVNLEAGMLSEGLPSFLLAAAIN